MPLSLRRSMSFEEGSASFRHFTRYYQMFLWCPLSDEIQNDADLVEDYDSDYY